jgi:hypothetical protein
MPQALQVDWRAFSCRDFDIAITILLDGCGLQLAGDGASRKLGAGWRSENQLSNRREEVPESASPVAGNRLDGRNTRPDRDNCGRSRLASDDDQHALGINGGVRAACARSGRDMNAND